MIYAEVCYGRKQLNASGELQNLEVLQLAQEPQKKRQMQFERLLSIAQCLSRKTIVAKKGNIDITNVTSEAQARCQRFCDLAEGANAATMRMRCRSRRR